MALIDTEIFKIVFQNLKSQKLRSLLTLLGIIIGIAAIVALISIGEGLNIAVQQQFESLGTNTIFILPGGGFVDSAFARLQEDDAETIEKIKGVEFATEAFMVTKQIQFGNETKTVLIMGIDPKKAKNLSAIGIMQIESGREISAHDSFGVVIGNKLATSTFEKPILTKQSLEMLDSNIEIGTLRVIGINKKSSNNFASFFNDAIIMNSNTLQKMSSTKIYPIRIFVKAFDSENVEEVKERIEKKLEKEHGEKDFQVMTTRQISDIAGSVIGIISIVLIGIAAISLLVGGIGIMNTMLMTVLERTKEIGIMKAIGATNNRILTIFLLESGFIGMLGGTIGLLFGIGISMLVSIAAGFAGFELPTAVTPTLIIGALAFSLIVGMIAGTIPAIRASRQDPVEALRYE